jgi:hypothetical protein
MNPNLSKHEFDLKGHSESEYILEPLRVHHEPGGVLKFKGRWGEKETLANNTFIELRTSANAVRLHLSVRPAEGKVYLNSAKEGRSGPNETSWLKQEEIKDGYSILGAKKEPEIIIRNLGAEGYAIGFNCIPVHIFKPEAVPHEAVTQVLYGRNGLDLAQDGKNYPALGVDVKLQSAKDVSDLYSSSENTATVR